MEKILSKEFFKKLLDNKTRKLKYTAHSIDRAIKRGIINKAQKTVPRFEEDILGRNPYLVIEQHLDSKDEKKFKLYYRAPEGGFIAYIFVLNSQMRLISVYKTTKSIQQKMYKCEKAMMKKR